MEKVRRCDSRCHRAKGTRCECFCGGALHGTAGAANRQAITMGLASIEALPNFKEGKTKFIYQQELPLEVK